MIRLDEVLEFVREHELMLLSTVDSSGKPQAAVVEFGELDDFTLVIDTLETSRKYKNLQASADVAAVIGWDNNITVQINGIAKLLEGEDLGRAKLAYFSKNPRARKWEKRPNIAYFAIKPTWIRYSDLNQDPWLVAEFEL